MLLRQKKSKFIVWSTFSCSTVFFSVRYFIETITTDIDAFLHVWLQFCNNNGFIVASDVIMFFSLDYWTIKLIAIQHVLLRSRMKNKTESTFCDSSPVICAGG